MKYKFLFIILFLLSACKVTIDDETLIKKRLQEKFSNSGFTLIYNENLVKNKIIGKKMHDRDLLLFQKNLKKGTSVKITNPFNEKTILAKVGINAKYPVFNNSVVSIRIAKELDLDIDEPYIIIEEVIGNDSFIAKKTKTYEEEKNVANKAPVDSISINNLNEKSDSNIKEKTKKRVFNYSIKIADFYYIKSAKLMVKRINHELNLNNTTIKKLSENDFRVLVGPFTNIKSLQMGYNSVQNLEFENLEIIRND